MKLKKFFRYYFFGESIKEIEMNRILEKISKKSTLSKREKNFLELYSLSKDEDKDLMYLSKNTVYKKVKDFLQKGKTVICDLHDRDGKIGQVIKDVLNNFEEETCDLILKDGNKHKLHDKFLYNLIYNIKKDHYSLQEQDEYFEKIESSK